MKAKRYRNAPCGPQGAPGAPERAGGYGTLPADETEALRGLQRRGGQMPDFWIATEWLPLRDRGTSRVRVSLFAREPRRGATHWTGGGRCIAVWDWRGEGLDPQPGEVWHLQVAETMQ